MGNEIELKLLVNQDVADYFSRQISSLRVLRQHSALLENCYYDTADRYFARHKMGLRVRREHDNFTLTLKTDGQTTGGLHIRPEYNVALKGTEPDLEVLAGFEELKLPPDLRLEPIFSTDFERRSWLIECGNGVEIEIALDQGEIRAGNKTDIIREVEFELKNGEITDLLTFVGGLIFTDGVRLSAISKAGRGYRLAAKQRPAITDWLDKWREILSLEQSAVKKTQEKFTALFHYEQQLIEETVLFGTDYFSQDFLRTVERVGAFFNLYHYYTEDNNKLLEAVFNEKQNHSSCDEATILELNESNRYLREKIRELIRLHSETKDNRLVMQKLDELLQQAQYVKRMINLMKLMEI